MRTTVTLDKDVQKLLREAMHRSRQSFKQALNTAVRAGLSAGQPRGKRSRFAVRARPLGLRPGIDPAALNKVADELELEAAAEKSGRVERS